MTNTDPIYRPPLAMSAPYREAQMFSSFMTFLFNLIHASLLQLVYVSKVSTTIKRRG